MIRSSHILAFFAAVLLFAGCGAASKSGSSKGIRYTGTETFTKVTPQTGPEYTVALRPEVDLRSLPKRDGWYILFDGTGFDGWRGYCKDHIPTRWSLDGGCMKLASKASAPELEGGDIIFEHRFKDFEVELEWKISKAGNSGIFYLGKEVRYLRNGKEVSAPLYYSSPEYQVLDNANHPDGKKGVDGNRMSASLYDMIPANPQNQNPWGEWNKVRITVKGGKVTHFQNGVQVLSYELGTPSWTEMLQGSKFAQVKNPLAFDLLKSCGSEAGYFGLQDHGNDVWYRNIRIKEL